MPELPDVEAFRLLLARHATGQLIEQVTAPAPDVLRNTTPQALGRAVHHRRFADPGRHGKWLFARTNGGDGPLVVLHFAMTGFLAWEPVGTPRDRHDRVVFVCADGELRFNQTRKLGGVWLVRDDAERDTITGPLGPDALDVGRDTFRAALTGRSSMVKSALMDQEVVAGLGNLTVDEVLWHAYVHPRTRLDALDPEARDRLYEAMRDVLRHDLDLPGNTTGMGLWRNPSFRRPAVSGVFGLLLAMATLQIDGMLPVGWLFGWQPPATGAQALLGAVTGSIITVSALVFWVRGMFVQLSAGQLSSRVLRWYLADRHQQHVLDLLVGVFAYTAAVTLAMGGGPTAPALSTAVSVALSVAALVVVIVMISDSARATELTEIMAQIARETIHAVQQTHPERGQGITGRTSVTGPVGDGRFLAVRAPAAGWVGQIHDDLLVDALPPDTTVRLWTRAGSFVLRDIVIADVHGVRDDAQSRVADAIRISRTRDVANDVELGLRNLVDIAQQALVVGTRDATSAYEAINYLASVVQEILLRDLPDDVHSRPDGRRVVRMAELGYTDYVELAFDQIRQSGAGHPAIASVLLTTLHMLIDAVTHAGVTDRVEPLRRQVDLVLEHVERSNLSAADRENVRRHAFAQTIRRHESGRQPDGVAEEP